MTLAPSPRRKAHRGARALGAAALGAGCLVLGSGGPAYSDQVGDYPCQEVAWHHDGPRVRSEALSAPLAAMGVEAAWDAVRQRTGKGPGEGVTVAVVDSGISESAPVDVLPERYAAPNHDFFHGTVVAGLIAGKSRGDGLPVGIAPEARILDVRVYDTDEEGQGRVVTSDGLEQGLAWLLQRPGAFDIVNISLRVPHDSGVQRLVRELHRRGKIVVASAGNRDETSGQYAGDEDVRHEVLPAGYPETVAVTTHVDEEADGTATDHVLASSETDVSAPTRDAVSYAVTGESCVLPDEATSWAAAEVSGVLALLRTAYPDETPDQLVQRLELTASGRPDIPGSLEGAGAVQALAAVTRPLEWGPDGSVVRSGVERPRSDAVVPPDEVDLLAETRSRAVWWGIVGGGAILLALLLRPVLSRLGR